MGSGLHLGAGCQQWEPLDVSQGPKLHFATHLLKHYSCVLTTANYLNSNCRSLGLSRNFCFVRWKHFWYSSLSRMHSFSLLDNTSLKEITDQKVMKTQKLYYNGWPSKDFKWIKSWKLKGKAKHDKAVTSISIHNIPKKSKRKRTKNARVDIRIKKKKTFPPYNMTMKFLLTFGFQISFILIQ